MKVLLINPPFEYTIQSWQPKVLEEGLDFLPPLGIMYIAAFLEKNTNHKVIILDAQVEELNYKKLKEKIKEINPDVIGITAMTFTLIDVIKTAKIAKEINPQVKIVLGGPHINIYPKETMDMPEIDFLVLGEGEKAFKLLLENMDNREKLKTIKGLVFRHNEEITNTGHPDFIHNPDELPFPARHLTPYKKYFSVISSRKPVTTMFTSRGCPYKCSFCDRPHMGKFFRSRSAKNVVDEMEECAEMEIKEIFMYDDTFGVNRQRVLDICAEIEKRNLKITWDIRTRVDTVDKEVLNALKKAGCRRINYGVEAGEQKILNILKKGITLEQVEKAFKETKEAGIETIGYFMIGSPTEKKEEIQKTINLMKKLNPDYVHVTITTPFPATELYDMAQKQGVIRGDPWREFAKNPSVNFQPILWEKELSRNELFNFHKKAYKSFYLRPSFVFKKIIKLKSLDELKRKAGAAIKLIKI